LCFVGAMAEVFGYFLDGAQARECDDEAAAQAGFRAAIKEAGKITGKSGGDALIAEGISSADAEVPTRLAASLAVNGLAEMTEDSADEPGLPVGKRKAQLAKAESLFTEALKLWETNSLALVSLGHLRRSRGDHTGAVKLYKRAAELPVVKKPRATWVEDFVMEDRERCVPIASYSLAHLLTRMQRHKEAVPVLQRFGVKYRIAPPVWAAVKRPPRKTAKKPCDPGLPCVLAGVVPNTLRKTILHAFRPGAPYWSETNYDTREYFSFFYDVKKAPSNAIEGLIQHCLIPNLPVDRKIVAAEWWVHARDRSSDMGHQLHFDMEERTLEAEGRVLNPAVSAVVYLAAAGAGPTLVLDQNINSGFADQGWLGYPSDGGCLFFPGDRLHGVVPSTPAPGYRVVLLVALWDRDDFAPGRRRKGLGPQADIPKKAEWVKEMPLVTTGKTKPIHLPGHVVPVSPVWEKIPVTRGPKLDLPCEMDQRYFVHHAEDFKRIVMKEHCGVEEPKAKRRKVES